MLADAAAHRAVVTAEDGVRDGGIGATIAARVGELSPGTVTRTLGLPTRFIPHAGSPEEILSAFGLDHAGIATAVRDALAAATDG
jgi:1-deoxy-D-xylulose-5-phosphate synthase